MDAFVAPFSPAPPTAQCSTTVNVTVNEFLNICEIARDLIAFTGEHKGAYMLTIRGKKEDVEALIKLLQGKHLR